MRKKIVTVIIVLLVILGALSPLSAAGRGESDPFAESAALPLNPQVRFGTLPNGLHYYLLRHPRPEGRAVLRLAVDAGSALEEEDQRGLAHFVEHMAFNGTTDFGENRLVAYLESLGNRFGPDVNAYTSFEETVYRLEVPARTEEDLAQGFHVMEQWAHAVTFDPRAVDRERLIIMEEWRSGRSASRRLFEQHVPTLLAASQYANRLPIGSMEVVTNVPTRRLVDYYRRWYRPDNMAFIAVGDFDLEVAERLVRRYFAPIARPERALHKPHFELPAPTTRQINIATDPETETATVTLYLHEEPAPFRTVRDYRELLERSLFATIINERIREAARNPNAPFFRAGIGWTRIVRPSSMAVATTTAKPGRTEEALEALLVELRRAARYGISETELARAKARFMRSMEESYTNFAAQSGDSLADELVRHYLQGEAAPGVEFEFQLYRRLMPQITVAAVNRAADSFTRLEQAIVLVSGPADGTIAAAPRYEQTLRTALARPITPPATEETPAALMATAPAAGAIEATVAHEAIGAVEYRLSNGARVVVKPTTFKSDEIVFSAFSPGGLSLVAESEIAAARLATTVAGASGIGALNATQMERYLAGKSVRVQPSIQLNGESIEGSAQRADFETLLQWVHLLFTAPRFDDNALEVQRATQLQQIVGSEADPRRRFGREVQRVAAFGDPRTVPLEREAINALTSAELQRVFSARFSNAADFIFVITGSLDGLELPALLERYLASLPGDPAKRETARHNGYTPPTAAMERLVRFGSEPIAQVYLLFAGDYQWSQRENQIYNTLMDVLDIRLREVIREDAGGAYGVGAAGGRSRDPRPTYVGQIFFGTDPARVDELTQAAFGVVRELRQAPPAESLMQRVKAQQLQQHRASQVDNGWWASVIAFALRHDRELATILDAPTLIEEVSAEEVQRAARDYLNIDRVLRMVLLPAE